MFNFAHFMRFLLPFISIILLTACGPSMNKIMKSKDPNYKLKMADDFYAKKKYIKAYTVYEDVLPFFKPAPNYQDVFYKYAYSAYLQKDYLNAENLFKTFLESFPSSLRYEEIEYMRAFAYYKQAPKAELDPTNTYRAIGLMQSFINAHPTSVRTADAQKIINELRARLEKKDAQAAKLYFDMKNYRAAGIAYNSTLEGFSDSEIADYYKYMTVQSFYKFAEVSVPGKKIERLKEVVSHGDDFVNRFPDSKYKKQVDDYISKSNAEIQQLEKILNNE